MEKDPKKTNKTIKIIHDNNEIYTINFINEGSKLTIEAKTYKDIVAIIYTNQLSLQDIKKLVRLFNDDFNSIDECMSEINFEGDNKNEKKPTIKKTNNESIIVTLPLYSNRFPYIDFSLKKQEKNEEQKYSELLNIIVNMKKKQEDEMKFLNDKINFLEKLLIFKKNEDYKKGLELFQGSVIEAICFGRNEIRNYFDMKQDYVNWKEGEQHYQKNPFFISFVFKCKDEKDIPSAIEKFKQIKSNYSESNIFIRVVDNKIFIEYRTDETDFFDSNYDNFRASNIFYGSGQSLIIKTNAIPKNIFEVYDDKEFLTFILDTELEFKNITPQILLLVENFQKGFFSNFINDIIRDIFFCLVDGNLKYKVRKELVEKDLTNIYMFFKNIFFETMDIFQLDKFKDYKKINFNEFELNLISTKYRAGLNFKFKLPFFNELIEEYLIGNLEH